MEHLVALLHKIIDHTPWKQESDRDDAHALVDKVAGLEDEPVDVEPEAAKAAGADVVQPDLRDAEIASLREQLAADGRDAEIASLKEQLATAQATTPTTGGGAQA